jgi:Holliday junction resolvasome RuvABC endonuclease subunit
VSSSDTGFADYDSATEQFLEMGNIRTAASAKGPEHASRRLHALMVEVTKLVKRIKPDVVAVEDVTIFKHTQASSKPVLEAIGVVKALGWALTKKETALVSLTATQKKAEEITGLKVAHKRNNPNGMKRKPLVALALQQRFGLPEFKPSEYDMSDAAMTAVCGYLEVLKREAIDAREEHPQRKRGRRR